MTDREKLIELILKGEEAVPCYRNPDVDCSGIRCPSCEREAMADFLISNGVTFAKDTDVPSKWIRVDDRLPSIYERVLVWCESKTIEKHVTACTYMGDGKFSRHVRCVTHWMPMPEPPVD